MEWREFLSRVSFSRQVLFRLCGPLVHPAQSGLKRWGICVVTAYQNQGNINGSIFLFQYSAEDVGRVVPVLLTLEKPSWFGDFMFIPLEGRPNVSQATFNPESSFI